MRRRKKPIRRIITKDWDERAARIFSMIPHGAILPDKYRITITDRSVSASCKCTFNGMVWTAKHQQAKIFEKQEDILL